MRQIVRRNIPRDAGLVGEEDLAPDLAVRRHAVLTGETRSVRQADDDFAIEARAFAKLQEIIGPGAFDHGSRADRASGRDQEGEERSNMRSRDLS